jgi:hypothetical protein
MDCPVVNDLASFLQTSDVIWYFTSSENKDVYFTNRK